MALLAAMLIATGCGKADEQVSAGTQVESGAAPADAAPPPPALADAAEALCAPAAAGALRARLQGAIDAELDWDDSLPQCLGGLRPEGDGLRLLYKGTTPDGTTLLLVFGLAQLRPGESARNVPTNVTVVREGTGQFYATQGEDKCAFDGVTQAPLADRPDQFRLEGRGYCTQPARAIAGEGAVLLSRFDVVAVVPAGAPGVAASPTTPAAER